MSTIKRKQYTAEFKEQVLELIAAGKPVPEIARDFEMSTSMIYRWGQDLRRSQGGSGEGRTSQAAHGE